MSDFSDTRIQIRRGTASEWSTANPTLGVGEPGYDTTNKIFKIGDGSTAWSSLPNYVISDISDITGNVSGVYNAVVVDSSTYSSLTKDPNTIYFVT